MMTQCRYARKGSRLRCLACGRRVVVGQPIPATPCRVLRGLGLPGSELKLLLSGWPFFIQATETCPCASHAAQMDSWGIEGCEARFDTIVGWLKNEAGRRGIPFIAPVARMLVRRAIARARKQAAAVNDSTKRG